MHKMGPSKKRFFAFVSAPKCLGGNREAKTIYKILPKIQDFVIPPSIPLLLRGMVKRAGFAGFQNSPGLGPRAC